MLLEINKFDLYFGLFLRENEALLRAKRKYYNQPEVIFFEFITFK